MAPIVNEDIRERLSALSVHLDQLKNHSNKLVEGCNKSAAPRARQSCQDIKAILTTLRKDIQNHSNSMPKVARQKKTTETPEMPEVVAPVVEQAVEPVIEPVMTEPVVLPLKKKRASRKLKV
jgi:hypothetical protein